MLYETKPSPVPHRLYTSDPASDGLRGIEFGGWRIERQVKPISDSETIESYEKRFGIPIPEMIFGDNYLKVYHLATGLELTWKAWDALALVQNDMSAGKWLKVAYADEWANYSSDALHHASTTVKKYDWTYSTTYAGTVVNPPCGEFEPSTDRIDYEKLKQKEPILFFEDIVLYEDELADNGVSLLNVKVRVMPSGFFVLQRFLMRVDGVVFRLFDTRVYHEFGTSHVIRECFANECSYNEVVRVRTIYIYILI
ncbi:TIP41-like family-domain-containing protein [Dimargaris cristalligena]|uniref:TIP41-like family-domain-containing protein n=1 Tax=Dimargaris cristalligena TaxID=215637 RepID=A0A4Q0A386_9FUNG|nr:TIP41-like family-domain-containing protein [Dimargaris cristalligena]|eukprot:RKP39720.1 TIP41-like family-domain-containing protein [Dimargaris cristalligena]